MHDDIARLPWLIRLSRRMLRVIKVNIAFGLLFNAAAVVAGGLGWLTPIAAALVHNAGSILVVLSSAGLAVFPEERPEA
jgi:Zn2+/Cd2+-exporting ATPase